MRPLLEFMDTYYLDSYVDSAYKKRRVWLSFEPSPACWLDFQTRVGRYIHTLTFNTSALVASEYCLGLLNRSACHVDLPCLIELRAIVDQTAIELELATTFMQPSVERLHLEVWEPLPDVHRSRYAMRREAELDTIRMFKFGQITPTAYPLTTFFSDIVRRMPGIKGLSFIMRDLDEMRRAWPDFLNLSTSLSHLQTLELPLRALTTAAVSSLTAHPTIRHLGARDIRKKREVVSTEPYEDLLVLQSDTVTKFEPGTLIRWESFTITAPPTELLSHFHVIGPLSLTLLHINFTAVVAGPHGINVLIAAIAETCPVLQDLKLCPITSQDVHNVTVRPNFEMLEPLRQLHDLASLEVIATHASQFTNNQFMHLISSWGKLTRLVLDHPDGLVPDPLEKADLSLTAVLRTCKKYCPRLQNFALYVSTDTGSPGSAVAYHIASSEKTATTSLQKVTLCLGYSPASSAAEMARMLSQELPETCEVEFYPTYHTIHDVFDSPEHLRYWITRNRLLRQFVKDVRLMRGSFLGY
ncbi:hypothetical protein EIP86_001696 [Pleurotus ostreatoroseus]|nr:hypothetical protein EIP86_001696 [Pleurotus ostreatoroseus]